MKWLDKLLKRRTHAEWLEQNPDKRAFHLPDTREADAISQKKMRDQMEGELRDDAARTQARNDSTDKPAV
ncbi:MAG: hypothetical protein ACKVVT_07475 [Dehalococcoidia bacterium]